MKNRFFSVYLKTVLIYLFVIIILVLILIFPSEIISAVKRSLNICYNTIIPSLFPFFVLSSVLIEFGFAQNLGIIFSPVMRPLFKVSGVCALPFVIGLVSGYPMGASAAAELYKKGVIGEKEAYKLIPFCNNSGPLFVIGAVGITMFNNIKIGLFIYVIHILSAISVGLIFRFYGGESEACSQRVEIVSSLKREMNRQYKNCKRSVMEVVSNSVSKSVMTTLVICGFLCIFSACLECIKPILAMLIKNEVLRKSIEGIFEVTLGINGITGLCIPIRTKIMLSCIFIGFGGLCVHLQVVGVTAASGLKLRTYMLGKSIQAVISAIYAYIALNFFDTGSVYTFKSVSLDKEYYNEISCCIFLIFVICVIITSIFRDKKY